LKLKGLKKLWGIGRKLKRCKLGILKEDSKSGWGSDRKLKSGIQKVVANCREVKKWVNWGF